MKKKLGALVLTLASLVISAACTTSRGPSQPKPEPDSGESYLKSGPSVLPARPVNAAAVHSHAAGLGSR